MRKGPPTAPGPSPPAASPAAARAATHVHVLPPTCPPPAPRHEEHVEVAARAILSPKETYDHIVAAGVAKTHLSLSNQVTQGVLAGFYISFSFMLCMTVGGQIHDIQYGGNPGLYSFVLGAVGFPLGLTVIMVAGADLFTSSCMYMATAWIEGRIATYYVIKNWILSWWCNLAGCLIMAQLSVWAGLFAGTKAAFPIALAIKKTSASFGATVVKGIFANWLVNLAVWMANSARDLTGKAVGVYLPVSAFVTLGGEHCIANQYQLSVAKMLGSGMSLKTIIRDNLVPATIGNIIGGAFFVGTLYAGTYGTLYQRMWFRTVQLYVWAVPRRSRERIAAVQQYVHDRLYGWIDWDYLTTAPADILRPAVAEQPPKQLISATPAIACCCNCKSSNSMQQQKAQVLQQQQACRGEHFPSGGLTDSAGSAEELRRLAPAAATAPEGTRLPPPPPPPLPLRSALGAEAV
ncbi:hypothetical protein HYH03_011550 [Edaphochlamys debaryana]|uniref:Uncharacterized protein n=1 Tax=Edaphochlamys debaryana TaxID=47281 RepID=A0A836BW95_9CHLO|nr:hypothetical protein HYH03_011550 [Edaphochlamys debaryana]|eukprot:KAG2489913.1 hypothetical protein HYH03_011550 [Edaphochlamys debaryana]